MRTIQHKPTENIRRLIEQILNQGHMSRKQHLLLTSAILSDQRITEDDRRQINRVFDYIQTGRLRLVD